MARGAPPNERGGKPICRTYGGGAPALYSTHLFRVCSIAEAEDGGFLGIFCPLAAALRLQIHPLGIVADQVPPKPLRGTHRWPDESGSAGAVKSPSFTSANGVAGIVLQANPPCRTSATKQSGYR